MFWRKKLSSQRALPDPERPAGIRYLTSPLDVWTLSNPGRRAGDAHRARGASKRTSHHVCNLDSRKTQQVRESRNSWKLRGSHDRPDEPAAFSVALIEWLKPARTCLSHWPTTRARPRRRWRRAPTPTRSAERATK